MAKKKNQTNPVVSEQESKPSVQPAPVPKAPQKLSIEQVALSHERKLSPRYRPQHLPSILAFCKSTGLPTSGTEQEMLNVLRRYGYKI